MNGDFVHDQTKDLISSGVHIGRIVKSNATVQITIDSYFDLLVKEDGRIVVKLNDRFKDAVGGICGNFDGESWDGLVDPQGCVYGPQDGIVFAAAWTDLGCLESLVRQNLVRHQWICPKTLAELALPGKKKRALCHNFLFGQIFPNTMYLKDIFFYSLWCETNFVTHLIENIFVQL